MASSIKMKPGSNLVSPGIPNDAEANECVYNLADFLPTDEDWLAFLKCLAEDNVEDLVAFSKRVNWENFLRSRDLKGDSYHCSSEFSSSVAMWDQQHPFPSSPFFVAMFYNARKCLLFMKESGVDFSRISEFGFNAYHNLLGAILFISTRRYGDDKPDVIELISLFHHTLFTREQQRVLILMKCHAGMDPLSWGVFLGLADYVECIIYYHSPDCVLKSTAVGIAEHITIDISMFVGENPDYFTSPLCVLLDLYGESTLPELKKLGIFRKDFIWKKWADVMFRRNRVFIYAFLVVSVLLSIATAAVTGAQSNEYLRRKCAGRDADIPVGTLTVLIVWTAFSLSGMFIGAIGVIRKEYHRRKANYPREPRQYYRDLVAWYLPNIIPVPICVFLLWLYIHAELSCAVFDRFINITSSLFNIALLLSSIVMVISFLRLVPPLTTTMSSFYNSLKEFALFILFFIILTAIFARMFQSSAVFSGVTNSTISRPDNLQAFWTAFYQTFLVSLNIVDNNMYTAQDDRIDLNVTHIFYILIVPIMFINFVVGILSSVVTHVQEHDVENRYIIMLSSIDYAERALSLVRKMFKPSSLFIKICVPLSPQSRLIKFCKSSLANPVSPSLPYDKACALYN